MTTFQEKVLDWAEQAETLYAGHVEIVLIKGVRLALGQLIDQEQNLMELERQLKELLAFKVSMNKTTALIATGKELDKIGKFFGLERVRMPMTRFDTDLKDIPFEFIEADESFRFRIMAVKTGEGEI